MSNVTYDPFDPEILADPFSHYEQLRDDAPVHYHDRHDLYTVARYDDATSIIGNPHVFSNDGYGPMFDFTYRDPDVDPTGVGRHLFRADAKGRMLLFSDPPLHKPLRRLAVSGFSPRAVHDYETRVRQTAESLMDDLIDRSRDASSVDIAKDYALKLPFLTICQLLGTPEAATEQFRKWVDVCTFRLGQPRDAEIAEASIGLCDFFDEVVEKRRSNPGDDIISRLVSTSVEGAEPMTTPEVVAFAVLLFLAGGDTAAGLISHWFQLALISHPETLEVVRRDRSMIPAAIEELLRWDNSNQAVNRLVLEDTEVAGVPIPKDSMVAVLLASANRDERHWGPDADVYRIDRNPTDSLAFGKGSHLCLGAYLARMEARVTIETFLDKVKSAAVVGPLRRQDSIFVRSCASMPVSLTPL
jgi:cytochrome P450